jgi:hypothetical protein
MEKVDQYKAFGLPTGPSAGNDFRRRHLLKIKAIREGVLPKPRTLEEGYVALSIPELDYYVIMQRFPDLQSPDAEIKRKAWLKFIRSPMSEPYRVQK